MMVLTGIAHETDFMDGTSEFFLIFNKGALRLPVPEETAIVAAQHLSAENSAAFSENSVQPEAYEEKAEVFPAVEEDPRKEVCSPPQDLSDYSRPPDHDVTESEDPEDGVDQV